ncbi:MAG TPA: Ig-like domain-containing protein, partial [Mycobacteriales bacterium]|nr:Ig-like domain-containing protein [Mycobacteriales bacterium]
MSRLRPSRRLAAVTVVVVGLLGSVAFAYFSAAGAGTASASVGTLSPPSNVVATATAGSGTVSITWNAPSTGVAPQGYYLLRHVGAGTVAACATSPSSLKTTTSCNDLGVPDGTYTYTVVAKLHSFTASANSNSVTVVNDNTAPTVTVDQKIGQADPTNAGPMLWTVTFSEPVTGFDATDLTRGGSSAGGTVAVTGSGASYEISLSAPSNNGTTTFSVDAAKAQDLAGNNNTASTSTDNSVTYDTVAPAVTVNQKAGQADPTNAAPMLWTVTFSESVTGFDATDLVRGG